MICFEDPCSRGQGTVFLKAKLRVVQEPGFLAGTLGSSGHEVLVKLLLEEELVLGGGSAQTGKPLKAPHGCSRHGDLGLSHLLCMTSHHYHKWTFRVAVSSQARHEEEIFYNKSGRTLAQRGGG